MLKLAGLIVVLGSLAFLVAAFLPITGVFIIERDAARLASRWTEWVVSLVLFGLGGTVTALGLGLVTLVLRDTRPAALASWLGLAALAVGAVAWDVIIYRRYAQPLAVVVQQPNINWLFVAYTLLTQAALIAYGFALLQAGYPRWLGWGAIGLTALLTVAYLIFKDVPPFAYYVITLIIGVKLLL